MISLCALSAQFQILVRIGDCVGAGGCNFAQKVLRPSLLAQGRSQLLARIEKLQVTPGPP